MKKTYLKPTATIYVIDIKELLQPIRLSDGQIRSNTVDFQDVDETMSINNSGDVISAEAKKRNNIDWDF